MGFDDEHVFTKEPAEWIRTNPLFAARGRRPLKPKIKKVMSDSGLLRGFGEDGAKPPTPSGASPEDGSVAPPESPMGRPQEQPPPRFMPQGKASQKKRQKPKGLKGLSKSAAQLNMASHPVGTAGVRLEPLAHAPGAVSPSGAVTPLGTTMQGAASRGLSKAGKGQTKNSMQAISAWELDAAQDAGGLEDEEEDADERSIVSLNEIYSIARKVSEAMHAVNVTAEYMSSESTDYVADVAALREIASLSKEIQSSVSEPPPSLPEEDYDDAVLARARKLAELTYELIEDIQLAADGMGTAPAMLEEDEEAQYLQDVNETTDRVKEEMMRLMSDSWAAAALAAAKDETHEGQEKPEGTNPEEEEDEDVIATMNVNPDDNGNVPVLDDKDPKMLLMVERTLAKVRGEVEEYSDAEVEEFKASFIKFKVPDSADIHKDDIDALLNYCGRWVPPEEELDPLIREVTMYDYMDFDEFLTFMKTYEECEREYQRKVFNTYDDDGSGNISITELRLLLSGLNLIPMRQMMQEALGMVDKNWDGELSFEELCCFLAVYRGSEGFTRQEVAEFEGLFYAVAKDEIQQPGPHMPPPEKKMCGKDLPSTLIQAFGMQVADNVEELQQMLASGEGFKVTTTSDGGDASEIPTISMKEFLILARKTREMELSQLAKEVPGMAGNKESGEGAPAKGPDDFELADADGNGLISEDEMMDFLQRKEFTPLRKVVREILAEVAEEALAADGEIDFNQFFDFLFIFRQRDGFMKKEVVDFKKAFEKYDEDNGGTVSTLELGECFRGLGYRISAENLRLLIDKVDIDGSNELDFREFLRLMRWHKESELTKYKNIFNDFKDEGDKGKVRGKYIGQAVQALGTIADDVIQQKVEAIPDLIDAEFDLSQLVDLIDDCRESFVVKERRKAGFSDDEIEEYKNKFESFDKDGSGAIDPKELNEVLKHFGWEPRSREERDNVVARMNTARDKAREAGVEEVSKNFGGEFGFWEFVQLARILHTLHDKAREQELSKIMNECNFSQKEVNQFHEVFSRWVKPVNDNPDEEEPEDDPTQTAADPYAGLNRDLVRRVMRSLGMSLNPEKKTQLDLKLDKLEEDGNLKFHGFLRLMKWVIDTDYAGVQAKSKAAGKKPNPGD